MLNFYIFYRLLCGGSFWASVVYPLCIRLGVRVIWYVFVFVSVCPQWHPTLTPMAPHLDP